ncbi:MAG: peptidylprolyl isomerase [Telluria sp.]
MTFKPARLLTALIAVVAVPAFAQNIAVVNGKAIPSSLADAAVKQVIAQGQAKEDSPQLREMIKKDLVTREVMMQEAVKRGFAKDATVKAQLEEVRQRLVVNALAREYITKNPITDAEVKAEYDRFKSFAEKEYHLRHILLDSEADAKAVIAKLKGGAKFEELAKTSKDAGTASKGGDLDWVNPMSFPKVLIDTLAGLKKGEVAENPVQTADGFHVVKLDDTRAAKLPTYEEVKPELQQSLAQKKLLAYQDAIVKKAKVQ